MIFFRTIGQIGQTQNPKQGCSRTSGSPEYIFDDESEIKYVYQLYIIFYL